MADVEITFLHPTDGQIMSVDLDDSITAQEIIAELIENKFIANSDQGYTLAIKGGDELNANQSLADANVTSNTTIRIINATNAGTGV